MCVNLKLYKVLMQLIKKKNANHIDLILSTIYDSKSLAMKEDIFHFKYWQGWVLRDNIG